ncbi:MAG: hypothetical protein EBS89_07500 [Proteobacteria bacterium]|nr:hypothetical protein [Pseudomonadota bacterium]
MAISKALSRDSLSLEDKARICLEHYEASKNPSLEPAWVHPAYDVLRKFLEGESGDEQTRLVRDVIASHECEDGKPVTAQPGVPGAGRRVIHDGWKIGSSTWVFMGRRDGAISLNDDWILVGRDIPADIFRANFDPALPSKVWIAYHRTIKMGLQPMQNFIGPTPYLEQVYSEFARMGIAISKTV